MAKGSGRRTATKRGWNPGKECAQHPDQEPPTEKVVNTMLYLITDGDENESDYEDSLSLA